LIAATRAQLQVRLREAAGVEFIPADDEKGPGLRLKHKARGKRVKRARGARQISLSGTQTYALLQRAHHCGWQADRSAGHGPQLVEYAVV
jgi:hypothetical protein